MRNFCVIFAFFHKSKIIPNKKMSFNTLLHDKLCFESVKSLITYYRQIGYLLIKIKDISLTRIDKYHKEKHKYLFISFKIHTCHLKKSIKKNII